MTVDAWQFNARSLACSIQRLQFLSTQSKRIVEGRTFLADFEYPVFFIHGFLIY